MSDAKEFSAELAIAETRNWLEQWVVAHNLCPFAAKPVEQGRVRIVADPAVIVDADVDFDDIAILNDTRAADAMNDFFVDRNADVPWELAVTEKGTGGACGLDGGDGDAIYLGGGHAGVDFRSCLQKHVTGDLTCLANGVLLLAVANGDVPRFSESHEPGE